jgi:hypothetical protein
VKYVSLAFGILSAGSWLWSGLTRLPAKTWNDFATFEDNLRKVGLINAAAAILSAVSILLSTFSN